MLKLVQNAVLFAMMGAVLLAGCATGATGNSVPKTEQAGEPETGIVKTDRFSMEYIKFGSGSKVLVIIPGLSVQSVMGSAKAVAEAYQLFAEDYTVYLFDRRQTVPSSYSIQEMADDTIDAMKALDLNHVNLLGVSQGGMIAMCIAMTAPELIDKLALGSTAARVKGDRKNVIEEWIRKAEEGDAEGLYLSFGEKVYPKELYEASKETLTALAETVTKEELEKFVIIARSIPDFDVLARLDREISCPVLALGSNDDQVLSGEGILEIAEVLREHAGFEYYMYDGYGHAAYDTAPDYKDRLLAFFAGEQ